MGEDAKTENVQAASTTAAAPAATATPPAAPAVTPDALDALIAKKIAELGLAKPAEKPAEPAPGLDAERLKHLLALEAADREAQEAKRREEEEQLLRKGKAEEVIRARELEYQKRLDAEKQRVEEATRKYREAVLERELASALGNFAFVPGGAEQVRRLLKDEFSVGDDFRVLSRQYEAPVDALKRIMAQPEYRHFLMPEHRPGTGSGGGGLSEPPPAGPAPEPKNLGEALVALMREKGGSPPPRSFGSLPATR